jgi:small-conductance mechanosensitive channel
MILMVQLLAQAPPAGTGGFNILQSLQSAFTTFVNYLPQLLGAIVVLIVGFIVAKILDKVITKLLRRAKVDDRLTAGSGGRFVEKVSPGGSPARLVGGVVFWVIMLFVISSAIGTLNIPALTGFMNLVLSYLPNVLAALLIFVVAALVAGAIGGLAHRWMGDTPTGRVVRTVAPALVMAIAIFMILTQLGIAPVIVTVTYVALVGAIALGSALAFGLGGRDAAADMINTGYRKAQEQSDTVREDLRLARERGERDAQRAREYADPQTQTGEAEAGMPRPTQPRPPTEQHTPRSGPGLVP